jgi:hypothetical protein
MEEVTELTEVGKCGEMDLPLQSAVRGLERYCLNLTSVVIRYFFRLLSHGFYLKWFMVLHVQKIKMHCLSVITNCLKKF